jgi:hypothetical protein
MVGVCVDGSSVEVSTCTSKLASRNVIADVNVRLRLLVLCAAAVSRC